MYKISSFKKSSDIWDTPMPDFVLPVFAMSYYLSRKTAKDYNNYIKELAKKDPSILRKSNFEKIVKSLPFALERIRKDSLMVPLVSLPVGYGLYKLRKKIFKKKNKLQQLFGG